MNVIAGSVRVDQLNQDRLVLSMEKFATKADDNAARFVKLTQAINGIESVGRMQHSFRELRVMPQSVVTTAVAAAAATTISVDNPQYFRDDDLIYCPATGEMFACAATPAAGATSITVRRITTATGTGIVTEIPSGSTLLNLFESHAEGESIPAARAVDQVTKSVYIYEFDETVKHTNIAVQEEDYGQNKLDEDRELAMLHMLRALNMVFYTGANVREVLSASGRRRHVPAGLEYYLRASATDASAIVGGFSLTALGDEIRSTKIIGASADVKTIISGSNGWSKISAWPASAVRIEAGADKTWGVTVGRLVSGFGEANVMYDPALSPENGLADRLFILDLKYIQQLQLRGVPLVMKTNIGNPEDHHNITDLVTGTRGLKLKLVELHKEIINL